MENVTAPEALLQPVPAMQRIQALDVVRGFALLGIFMMNIEWFNRPQSLMGAGVPATAALIDRLAGWFVVLFVTGKFWTIFSFLFGVGFAVMLQRAEAAGRPFLKPYLRRLAALAVFGAAHHILIWTGDILFSYAVGAGMLLILLYGRWHWTLASLVLASICVILTKNVILVALVGGVALVAVAALFLRTERGVTLFGRRFTFFSLVFLVPGLVSAILAGIVWVVSNHIEKKLVMTAISIALLGISALAAWRHLPRERRPLRLAVFLYIFPFLVMTLVGISELLQTRRPAAQVQTVQSHQAPPPAGELERGKKETQLATQGTYRAFVAYRANDFRKSVTMAFGLSIVLVGMFLLGAWFVQAGIMGRIETHLGLFRKLAWIGLPIGLGVGFVGAWITTLPGGRQLGEGLALMGNLPASLGYFSVVVLLLHSGKAWSKIRVLAPAGRMALTNYLGQSLLCSFVFYAYGLGRWGMGRAAQVLFVVVVFAIQVALSHLWLRFFHYGPMEWLWRAITYWTWPAKRLGRDAKPLAEVPQEA